MEPEPRRELGAMFGDEFAFERELGRGGMGAVYLVRNRATGQQFAVKTPQLRNLRDRKRFTHELQHWFDLPEHPNLVACHFSRTHGSRVLIFAEYVSGGSLGRWIAAEWLHSAADVLDVAIQLARGLHVLHAQGLVHLDVKPENTLVTEEGIVKVTDFGLARARSAASSAGVLASGMTPAFRSPEQASGGRVDARTDQWSWALTVFAMFNGGVTWRVGEAGPAALEDHLNEPHSGGGRALPRMPPPVAEVLARALDLDPADRWPSLEAAAQKLEEIYRDIAGIDYVPGRLADRANRDASGEAGVQPSTGGVASEFAPHTVGPDGLSAYRTALDETTTWYLEDRDGPETEAFNHGQPDQSPAARAAREAHHYGEIQRKAQVRFDGGDRDPALCSTLVDACERAGDAHHRMGDLRAAVRAYEQAIAVYHELVKSQREWVAPFVKALRKCSLVWGELHRRPSALALLYQARNLLEEVMADPSYNRQAWTRAQRELLPLAGMVTAAEGRILIKDNRATEAAQAFTRAVLLMERHVAEPGVRWELAQAHIDNGVLLHKADLSGALRSFDKAIALLEGPEVEASPSSREQLAEALLRKAVAYSAHGDAERAIPLLARSIQIREGLVQVHKFVPAMIGLGASYSNMRDVVEHHQGPAQALEWSDRAVQTWDELVHRHGRDENLDRLAAACIRKGQIELRLNLVPNPELDKGRRLAQYLVKEKGRVDLRPWLELAERLWVVAQAITGSDEYRERRQKWLAPNPASAPQARQEPIEREKAGPSAADAPVARTDKPPVARADKPPVARVDKPPVARAGKPPVARADKPPVARAGNPPHSPESSPVAGSRVFRDDPASALDETARDFWTASVSRNPTAPKRSITAPPQPVTLTNVDSAESTKRLPSPVEVLAERNLPPGCIVRRARVFPALLLVALAAIESGFLISPLDSAFAVLCFCAVGVVFLWACAVLLDGLARRTAGCSAYALTREHFTWSSRDGKTPGWIPFHAVTNLRLSGGRLLFDVMTDRHLVPMEMAELSGGSFREWLLRPSSAAALWNALRARMTS